MAVNLSPFGGVGVQFFDNSGNPLTGGKIFTYAAGTTTPQATYTTAAGTIPHTNPIILDAGGRVPSGGEIWLTDGLQYKFLLKDANDVQIASYDNIVGINSNFVAYTSQQEIQTATAGQTVFTLTTMQYQPNTNNLSVFVDGVNQYGPGAQYAFVETDSTTVTFTNGLHVGAEVKFTTAALVSTNATDAENVSYTAPYIGAVTTNVENKLAQIISVKDFGAVGDGVTDDSAAINAAIAAMANPSTLVFPQATYKVDSEILIPYSGVNGSGKNLYFDNCTIIPGNDNMNIIHWCDSYGSTMGRVKLFSSGRTGITCFRVTPELENANVTVTNQNYNRFMAYMQCSGADEGIVLMAGLPIGGTASGCWYNVFSGAQFGSVKRCIWLKDNGSVDIASSGSNSNTFYSMIMNGSINTGIQIDAGGGNMFYSAQFENITLGVSPNAVPTALVIANAMANTGDNPNNMFYSPHWENCTRHSDIDEPITQMIFADMDFALSAGSAVLETYIPVANNASQQFILAGIRSQATVEEVRIDNDGNVLLGGTNSLTASGNELVLQNGKNVSGVDTTGTTLYTMIKVNTSDEFELGSGSINLVVSSAQWAGASPALVTVGAADSGGVGYRVLRIPN